MLNLFKHKPKFLRKNVTFLPKEKQEELRQVVKQITKKIASVQMIILFGSYARDEQEEDSYVEDGIGYSYTSDYDILVIINREYKTSRKE